MPLEIRSSVENSAKHEYDITSLLFQNNKLYSGADDGKIKVWDRHLKLIEEIQAHPCSIFSLAFGDDTLYSCSNDGTVKGWTMENLKEKCTVVQEENEMWKVCFDSGKLYVGDDAGIVKVFENNKIVGVLEIMHPITELLAINNLVYTARDLYVIISEVFPDTKKIATLKAIEGRAPLCIMGKKICFPSRSGRDIFIHENSKETDFKEVGQIKGAHEMIINALCAMGDNYLFTGGWDKQLKKWKITDNSSAEMVEECPVDMCITSITKGGEGELYIGGGDGKIIAIDVK